MSSTRTRRLLASASLASLIAAYLTPAPTSVILLGLGLLLAIALMLWRRKEPDLAAQALEVCDNPDLMTVWEVSEASGLPTKTVVLALSRDEVPRADRVGWRARLPVPITQIRYRRTDIARWLGSRNDDSAVT